MKKYRRPSILRFRSSMTPTRPDKRYWYGEFSGRHRNGKRFLFSVSTPYKQSRTLSLSPLGFFEHALRMRRQKYGR